MKNSPLLMGSIYIFLGIIFTTWAIQLVNQSGWGIFVYLLLLIATFDIGAGIRLVKIHFRLNKEKKDAE